MATKEEKPDWLEVSDHDVLLQERCPKIGSEMSLQQLFSACHQELTDQQRKRDQLISFYLTLAGILISVAFAEFAAPKYKIWIFAFLAVLGFGWSLVILRYRIYKEVYWITCRTISALYTLDRNEITKERIQAIFYRTMVKRVRSRMKQDKAGNLILKNGHCQWSVGRLIKKHIMSAEKIMYTTIALIACISFGLFWGYFLPHYASLSGSISAAIGFAIGFLCYLLFTWYYYHKMCKLYAVAIEPTDKAFNEAYEKAWFLHIYVTKRPDNIADAS